MCSVVGFLAKRGACRPYLMHGLRRLEYRGYDSAGLAHTQAEDDSVTCVKTVGGVDELAACLEDVQAACGRVGIGHTRWCTHGSVSRENAHPHVDQHGRLYVVHNGIIENYRELARAYGGDAAWYSQTDTEVLARVLASELALGPQQTPAACLQRVVEMLTGSYAFVALEANNPERLLFARCDSPLCIGFSDEGAFIASDPAAFAEHVSQIYVVPQSVHGFVTEDALWAYDATGCLVDIVPRPVGDAMLPTNKGAFPHYMLKEIYDTKTVIRACVSTYKQDPEVCQTFSYDSAQAERLVLIGCGTSAYAARVAGLWFEDLAGIPTQVVCASEFRHVPLLASSRTVYCALSQSGETADTLAAVRRLKENNCRVYGLINVVASSMGREVDGVFPLCAGHEQAVASTKSFTAQLSVLYMLANRAAHARGEGSRLYSNAWWRELTTAASVGESTLENYRQADISNYVQRYAQHDYVIFLGRHLGFPFAQEAALKVKELSYQCVECCPAGELKHGVLALVTSGTPVVVFSSPDQHVEAKLVSAIEQVKSRGAHVLVFAFAGQERLIQVADDAIVVPQTAGKASHIAMAGIMQYFAYALADARQCPIDKPRNLAKSVTVE